MKNGCGNPKLLESQEEPKKREKLCRLRVLELMQLAGKSHGKADGHRSAFAESTASSASEGFG